MTFDDEAEQATKVLGQTKKTSVQPSGSTSISEYYLFNEVALKSWEDLPADGPMLDCDQTLSWMLRFSPGDEQVKPAKDCGQEVCRLHHV